MKPSISNPLQSEMTFFHPGLQHSNLTATKNAFAELLNCRLPPSVENGHDITLELIRCWVAQQGPWEGTEVLTEWNFLIVALWDSCQG